MLIQKKRRFDVNNKILCGIFALILLITLVSAVQPTHQYIKSYLNPFYRFAMTNNVNHTYSYTLNPPDKVSEVTSAIISFEVYLTPTVTFYLWVDNKPCNNPSYIVSTTFASAGLGKINFDCSNVITKAGTYNITLKPVGANTGAITGWIDTSYYNNPAGEFTIHGTEYTNKQIAKPWLQLLDSNGSYVNNGVCYIDIYTPDAEKLVDYAEMTNMQQDGIYYFDYALTDLPEGVYPVTARCYYIATQTSNRPMIYFTQIGTWDSGTVDMTYAQDGTFIRFKEAAVNPVRNITVGLNFTNSSICTNIPEALFTGISINVNAKFDSVVNDDVTIAIFNYTLGDWQDLPNKLLESASFQTVSNVLSFNNISKTGFVNASGSNLRLRFKDTALADGTTSNLDIDYLTVSCDQLASPSWQEVKGSSEIHISATGDELFYEESLCGEYTLDGYESICSEFRNNLSYANVTWGYIYDKVTYYNSYNTNIDETDTYATSLGQDCTGILDVTETRGSTTISIYDNITFSQGYKDNCVLSIPVIFNSTENDFYVEITQENYMKWEVDRKKDLINYYRLPIEDFCTDVATSHGITYQIPIAGGNDVTTLYASNPILLGCYRSMDDLYWFDYYYDTALTINTTGDYESYMYNIDMYYEELKDGSDAIMGITGQNILINVNTLCGDNSNYPNQYSCEKIMAPDAYFSGQEGYILQNLTVLNSYNTTSSGYYSYTTAVGVDCSAVMEVIKSNGTTTDIISEVLFNSAPDGSCNMNIPINNVQGIASYQIEIYMENYIYWGIYWARDLVNNLNDTIVDYCDDIATSAGINYTLPINSSIEQYRNNSQLHFCYRAMDDLYWWYFFYDALTSSGFTMTGEIGSYRYESEFFWIRIVDDYNTILRYQRNVNQLLILDGILDLRENTHLRVWNSTNRSISGFNFTVNVNLDYNLIAENIWNYTNRNLTFYQVSNLTTQDIWTYVDRSLTYYNNSDNTNYTLINEGIWAYNNRTLTYYPIQTDMTNYTLITGNIWSYSNRTLSYYEVNNMTLQDIWSYNNRSLSIDIPADVWNYFNRTLTFYQINNITTSDIWSYNNRSLSLDIAELVWMYVSRNLTYYPVQTDLTNYTLIADTIWNYANRNLTYVPDMTNYSNIQFFVWNATNRNLTFYPTQTDLTNYPLIQALVWNATNRNLTYYPTQIDLTNYSLITENIWNAPSRNLTYYADVTNYPNVALYVWNFTDRNLTYYQSVDLSQIPASVWNYSIRNLTYYPTQIDLTNYSLIAQMVWEYQNRNLTFYELNTLTASEIWNFAYRNLTFYPTQVDMTNYSLIAQTIWDYNSKNLTYYQINNITAEDIWNFVSRNLTYTPVQTDLTNYTLITENIWAYNNRTLTYYLTNNLTVQDIWQYYNRSLTQDIANQVWLYQDRNLTYIPYNNLSVSEIWDYVNRSLSMDIPFEIWAYNNRSLTQNLAFEVWYYADRNLTYYPSVDLSQIPANVWNFAFRNLTYYEHQDLTNYTKIVEDIWSYMNRTLTFYPTQIDMTNYTLITENIWSYANRNLTFYETNNITTQDIWEYVNRTLTYYPTQSDLTNYTKISDDIWSYNNRSLTLYLINNLSVQDIWAYGNRSLTYYDVTQVNETSIAISIWDYNNRSLTYYELNNLSAADIWNYIDRNLTYYPTQIDLTNYTKIVEDVWSFSNRSLTFYETNNITVQDIWDYVNRSLTYYELSNLSSSEIWGYVDRNLTYYPTQIDMTNYSKIVQDTWDYTNRSLTYYEVTQINESSIAIQVWDYNNRSLTYYEINDITPNDIWNFNNRNLTYYQLTQVNETSIAYNIWNYIDRNLTYYPTQVDLTNYTLIANTVWSFTDRNLTYYQILNITAEDIWSYFNRTLSQDIAGAVWMYQDRNLTYYQNFGDLTNYSLITGNIWAYNNRTLTYYEVNNITSNDIWNFADRNLTYYQVNNLSVNEIWDYFNRTLTYYPSQLDLTNYSQIALVVWSNPSRNLTYYEDVMDYTLITDAITNSETNINSNIDSVASDVWSYAERNLTYYPTTVNLSCGDIGNCVWNYSGNISQHIQNQLGYTIWNWTGGIFELRVNCSTSAYIGENVNCDIAATLEDLRRAYQVETNFVCYIIKNGTHYSEQSFNKMIDNETSTLNRNFLVPSVYDCDEEARLECIARIGPNPLPQYRSDIFYTTFLTQCKPSGFVGGGGGTPTGWVISNKTEVIIPPIFEAPTSFIKSLINKLTSTFSYRQILMGIIMFLVILCLCMYMIILGIINRRRKKVFILNESGRLN